MSLPRWSIRGMMGETLESREPGPNSMPQDAPGAGPSGDRAQALAGHEDVIVAIMAYVYDRLAGEDSS